MPTKIIALAAEVVTKADRERTADAVLRAKLKAASGITRNDGARVSEAVFAYYRWLGWLGRSISLTAQLEQAVDLDRAFQQNSAEMSDAELERAVPDWVKASVDYSPAWLRTLQLRPRLWLRARTGQGWSLAERLGECWLAGDGWLGDALRYDGTEDLFRTPEFHAGEFELQDLSSQTVGWMCQPQPDQTWWDACAGEGGKLLHLADLMKNKGLIWASDRAEWRLQKLKRRAARAKVFNYRSVLWNGTVKLPTKTKFDGILVDAPCSGIGTWQRNPQARWTTAQQDVTELSAVQKNLVANALAALKPGGKLIYSVCTLSKAETTEVAAAINERFPHLERLTFPDPFQPAKPAAEQVWLWPQDMDGNGMFITGWKLPIVTK